jgi:hypothetical protein
MFCFIAYDIGMCIYLVLLEVAAKAYLAALNGPLTDTDIESFEKFIRSTVAVAVVGVAPPPNQP